MQARPSTMLALAGACLALLGLLIGEAFGATGSASAFKGSWVGPWQEATSKQSGVFLLAIDGGGIVQGVVTNGAAHGIVHGAIAASGELDAVYSYDGKSFFAAKGRFARSGDHLRGTASYFTSKNQPLGSSDLDLRLTTEKPDSDVRKIAAPAMSIVVAPRARAAL